MNDVVSVSDVDQASDVDLESTAGWVNDVVSVSDVDLESTAGWVNDVVSVSDVDLESTAGWVNDVVSVSDVDLESTAGWVNDVVSVSDVDQVSTADWVNELDEMTVDDLIVVKIVTSMIRDDLDEMKNVVYVQRSGFCGTYDSSQTILLMRNEKMRKDSEVMKMTKTYAVDWKNDEVESYDHDVAVSEIFCEMSSSIDCPVL